MQSLMRVGRGGELDEGGERWRAGCWWAEWSSDGEEGGGAGVSTKLRHCKKDKRLAHLNGRRRWHLCFHTLTTHVDHAFSCYRGLVQLPSRRKRSELLSTSHTCTSSRSRGGVQVAELKRQGSHDTPQQPKEQGAAEDLDRRISCVGERARRTAPRTSAWEVHDQMWNNSCETWHRSHAPFVRCTGSFEQMIHACSIGHAANRKGSAD
jgi:hypothetical protein